MLVFAIDSLFLFLLFNCVLDLSVCTLKKSQTKCMRGDAGSIPAGEHIFMIEIPCVHAERHSTRFFK